MVKKISWERENFGPGLWDGKDLDLGRMTGEEGRQRTTLNHRQKQQNTRMPIFPSKQKAAAPKPTKLFQKEATTLIQKTG